MTEEYLEQRAARGSRSKLKKVLAKVPDVSPDKEDQMPAGVPRRGKRAG